MSEAQQAKSITIRGETLREAIGLTEGVKDGAYGDPKANLAAHGELLAWYRKWSRGNYGPGHEAAISQVLSKLARIATAPRGSSLHKDNYVDGEAYFGIAFECETVFRKESAPDNPTRRGGPGEFIYLDQGPVGTLSGHSHG